MPVELTLKTLRKLRGDLVKPIQDQKIVASKEWVRWGQSEGMFPPDDQLNSYVTSTNPNNRYVGAQNFWTQMDKSYAKNWRRRFIHVGDSKQLNELIAEAAVYARSEIAQRTANYGFVSGTLVRSITTEVNGVRTTNIRSAIIDSETPPIFEISNYAEYGSTAEARSYFSAQQGIIYYVARRVQTRYPNLGVLFYFARAKDRGLPHIYDVPVLRIAEPSEATGRWGKPGTNIRRRLRAARSVSRRLGPRR